ncbi:DUF262 domain-containing protein [Vibrio cholerae]|uniref:DUF262 domain-containing protein n=1 Tax=Vibrio cholerae TaxID=666 RepID=UPI0011DB6970|nr:DUF262 domain-containing protein [Vibrio cholerae]EHD2267432.1 DUF262 domain-containing protein [Vibrio cholerae]EKF9849329.1 DUF262 domain-containing protein [Vibrio cholerae]ELJ8563974.1 DUF262 domain-containing protein [Vibrio cholerae]ELJ8608913.1 DUF262 domain-containing protein [Vibrio cholerae]MDV2379626.1 DUF262 domain-containing protein [Vibrio cholerae]
MPDHQVVNSHLCLKSVYELLDQHFYIPAYQRGYRWTEIQVRELLDDIWEFIQQTSSDKSAFYCLQPIVVVKRNQHWELVDGQQRLTTLYIILHFLEKEHLRRELTEAYKKSLYSMEYETRTESSAFLGDIQPAAETDNIDFYHMAKAYEVVTEWFKDRDYNENNQLLATLLAKPDSGQSVKVIWYDLTDECIDNDYAVDVFSRINIGKIPLTNAELVKALFLQRSHFEQGQASLKQIQIASEWDAIEKQLQQSDFWYFIYNVHSDRKYETSIEYIFDLMKGKKPGDETYFSFHKFNAAFKQGQSDIESLWKEIQDYFLTFDEWFRDRELYHLIGFLVDCGHNVARLKAYAEQNCATKTAFKAYLKDEIRKEVRCQLSELTYGDPYIKKVLLLFNIQTLLATKEADVRFPFDRYKKERWNIEHIQSQTDTELSGPARDAWLDDVHEYFKSPHLAETPQVHRFLEQLIRLKEKTKVDDSEFNALYNEVCTYFVGEDRELPWIHDIGNLALLDLTTNCSYKNALFQVKRARIIKNDMRGVFVPICTKNVFLKFYSKSSTDLLYWRESDANDYTRAIAEVLSDYLPEQGDADE